MACMQTARWREIAVDNERNGEPACPVYTTPLERVLIVVVRLVLLLRRLRTPFNVHLTVAVCRFFLLRKQLDWFGSPER